MLDAFLSSCRFSSVEGRGSYMRGWLGTHDDPFAARRGHVHPAWFIREPAR
jgi:hypothetical protein